MKRTVHFRSLGAAIVTLLFLFSCANIAFTQKRDRGSKPATLEVQVLDFTERTLPRAEVAIQRSGQDGRIALRFDKRSSTFRASNLTPGRYTLQAQHRGLETQTRSITLQSGHKQEVMILGKKGMPFYYRGRVKVPFEPKPDLIAVTVASSAKQDDARLMAAAKKLQLDPAKISDEIRQSGARLFRLKDEAARDEKKKAEILRMLSELPMVVRAGPVVSVRDRSMSYLTNELIVRFGPQVTEKTVRDIARRHELGVLRHVRYAGNTWHFSSGQPASYKLLETAEGLSKRAEVEWAEPNLVTTAELDEVTPSDYLWPGVWDRKLVGVEDAWQTLQDNGLQPLGEPSVIIAAVDQGIESSGGIPVHEEFKGTVSDGSSKVYKLYDFRTLVPNNDSPPGNHGMGVSGVATAKGENAAPVAGQTEGLAGAAPNCRVMGLIYPYTEADIADMYIWAAGFDPNSPRVGFPSPISPGADVFTTSIGFGAGAAISGLASNMLDFLTTYGRGGKGCLCFFSAGNANNNFTTYRPWAAYQKTWGMAASTLDDDGTTEIRAPYSGFGPVELCAPSHDQYPVLHNPPTNYGTWSCQLDDNGNLIGHAAADTTLNAAATPGDTEISVANAAGFGLGDWILIDAPGASGSEAVQVTGPPVSNQIPVTALMNAHVSGTTVSTGENDYRNNFGGTSSATPLTAGVAALVLSANPNLTWIEARQIMRDTAVKIDAGNTDPIGQWLDANGNPSVGSGLPPVYSQWYGYGRVNAAAAVNQAITYGFDRDLVVRENTSDNGTVPSGGAFWNSPDIWVRNASPASEGAAALPASYANAGPHQNPIASQDNWVYCRLRNFGSTASYDAYVRIYITHFPGLEFTYPSSFIPSNRPGEPVPSPMQPGTYLIDEVLVTDIAPGATEIVNVLWPSSLVPPEQVMVDATTVSWHPCLLVEISPHDGPSPTGNHVWDNNNLAQKNISIDYPDIGGDFATGLVLGHPESTARQLILEVNRTHVPRDVQLYVDLVDPKLIARLQRLGRGTSEPATDCDGCTITFLEQTKVRIRWPHDKGAGLVLTLPANTMLEREHATSLMVKQPKLEFGRRNGRTVVLLNSPEKVRIPVLVPPGTLTPVIIGGTGKTKKAIGTHTVTLLQRNNDGTITGGAAVRLEIGKDSSPELRPDLERKQAFARMKVQLVDPNGPEKKPIDAVEIGDSVSIGLSGLAPETGVQVFLNDDRGREWSYTRRFADKKGTIEPALFWYHTGVIGTTSRRIRFKPDPAFQKFEEAEAYFAKHPLKLTIKNLRGRVIRELLLPVKPRKSPLLYPSNKEGVLLNSFDLADEDIYVTGRNFPAGSVVHLLVVKNQYGWNVGDRLLDVSGPRGEPAIETVTLGPQQTGFTVKVWDRALGRPGAFDLVARPQKEFGRPVLLASDILAYADDTAFLYYAIINGNIVIESAGRMRGAPAKFEFSDSFEKLENVYAAVDPTDVPAVHSGGNYAAYYVVEHQPNSYWDGPNPVLSDVSGGIEIQRVKYWCINASRTLVWPSANQAAPIKNYDVVVDFGATPAMDAASFVPDSTYNKGTDFIDGYDADAGFWVFEDPSSQGPYPVGQVVLDDPNGISGITDPTGVTGPTESVTLAWARIMYPATAAGTGTPVSGTLPNYPVALFLHGRHRNCDNDGAGPGLAGSYSFNCPPANRIPSHEGYNYIMERLASQGIFCISISAHDIQPGLGVWDYDARGRLILKFLDKLEDWNDNGTDPFGAIFAGRLDMTRIGLSGHSRGGEGVVAAQELNKTWPTRHSIVAVNAIAPTDQNAVSYLMTDAPYFLLVGARDGDVSNMQGFRTYDRAFPEGAAVRHPKTVAWVYRANHNYFNTIWTDTAALGSPNPWSGSVDDAAGFTPVMPAAEQRQVALTTIAAFFRRHLQGIEPYREIFTGRLEPATLPSNLVFWTYQDGQRKAIDDFEQTPLDATINRVGGMATAPGFSMFEERLLNNNASDYPGGLPKDTQFYHDTLGLKLAWAAPQTYTTSIPPGHRDASGFTHLTFRVAKKASGAPVAGPAVNLHVNIQDGAGKTALSDLRSDQFDVIPHPFEGSEIPNQALMSGVRIPLRNFTQNNSGVNLTDIVKITIRTEGAGEIGLDDIEFGK